MQKQRGFTFIEVILVIVLLGIMGAVFGGSFAASMRATLAVDTRKEALQNARVALDRMARDIRLIRSRTAADIPTFTATNLVFTDSYGNAIQFQLVGNTIQRNGAVLAGNVTALDFDYLQNNGAVAGAANLIWRIVMDVTVLVGTESVQLRTEVHPTAF
jgi:prepilin-type N-terminal cleavage/methylation domain-containing protein